MLVQSKQYKGTGVSGRPESAVIARRSRSKCANLFLIGIFSLAEKNTCYIPHRSWKLKKFSGANQYADEQFVNTVVSKYLFIQRGNEIGYYSKGERICGVMRQWLSDAVATNVRRFLT